MLCKGATIVGAFARMREAIKDGVITDPRVIQAIETASRRQWNFQKPGVMTSRKEINLLKKVLDKAISSIK